MPLRYALTFVLALAIAVTLFGLSQEGKTEEAVVITLHEPIFDPTVVVEEVIRLAVWPPDLRMVPEGDTGTGLTVDVGEPPSVVCDIGLPPEYNEICQ